MIEFKCSCGTPLQADEQYVGRLTRCPQCGREQPIPARDNAIRSDVAAERARARSTDVQEEPGRRFGDRPYAADAPQGTRTSGKAIAALVFGLCALVFSCLAGLPALILGILALIEISNSNGRLSGKALALMGMVLSVFSFLCLGPMLGYGLYFTINKVETARDRSRSRNNLKQLGLAMHSYHDANGFLPPAQSTAPIGNGGPNPGGLHKISWRVRILPYIEESNLYMQYREDEPWDGPNNSRLLQMMPEVYKLPGDETAPPGYTYYQVFVSNPSSPVHSVFSTDSDERVRITSITDGTSNTIMIVEGATPVPWTKPEDIPFDNNAPAPPIGTHYNGGCNAAFADGSVTFLPGNLSATTLKAYITRDGGEVVPLPGF